MKHFIGIDLGDKLNNICVLSKSGEIIEECVIENTQKSFRAYFSKFKCADIAIEASTHSLWVHDLLVELKFNVFVANSRKVALISNNEKKTDKMDALLLSRLVRSDPELLFPVTTRDMSTQKDFTLIKTRNALVQSRGDLVRHLRGIIKPFGLRFPDNVTPDNIYEKSKEFLSKDMLPAFGSLIKAIKELNIQIKKLDKKVNMLIKKKYPEALRLQTINGVGPITSLTFVLIMGNPKRFKKSRDVGAYFGMVPRRDQSGDMDKSLHITKKGDSLMRSLLVNCTHYILGRYGEDTQIRRYGLKLMGDSGNKIRKKKAVIAVARKLSVLMHSMLISGQSFENKVG